MRRFALWLLVLLALSLFNAGSLFLSEDWGQHAVWFTGMVCGAVNLGAWRAYYEMGD